MGEYVQPQVDTSIKSGSFAFFLAIPCAIAFAAANISICWDYISSGLLDEEATTVAAYAFIATTAIFSSRWLTTFRTFLHELKHAVVVLLSGNRVNDFRVSHRRGHVSYLMYTDRTRFAPFIMLAPYFFPLLSLLPFIAAIIINHDPQRIFAAILGATLAADITCVWKDYHPAQSDLQRISGGKLFVLIFILGTNLLWISTCLLWLFGGRQSFVAVWRLIMVYGNQLFTFFQTL